MILDDVHRGISKHKRPKRLGRGLGSGQGKTAGRGHKGAGSRAGYSYRLGFEGGQVPLARRVAKRGFSNNFFTKTYAIVNLATLEDCFESGAVVDLESLRAAGLVKGQNDLVKILANGDLTKKLTVKANRFSAAAVAKIQKAGGSVEVIDAV
jgi:large subunit ribosomal protein L15